MCNKLEQLKQIDINPNDEKLLELKQLFQKNHNEIIEINKQIKELKETEELIEKQKLEQCDSVNIFKIKDNNIFKSIEEENMNISIVVPKKNRFSKLIMRIKEIFGRKNK